MNDLYDEMYASPQYGPFCTFTPPPSLSFICVYSCTHQLGILQGVCGYIVTKAEQGTSSISFSVTPLL